MTAATDIDLDGGLRQWASERWGGAAEVRAIAPMPGNSGLSFGFDVYADGATERFVIRLAPPGVRRQGNTDVLAQVPILRGLADRGLPVAPLEVGPRIRRRRAC